MSSITKTVAPNNIVYAQLSKIMPQLFPRFFLLLYRIRVSYIQFSSKYFIVTNYNLPQISTALRPPHEQECMGRGTYMLLYTYYISHVLTSIIYF